MNIFLESLRFSRKYLARYWVRFVLGIVLGIFFGVSNGLALGSVYLMLNRLDDPAHVQKVTEEAREKAAEREAQESAPIHGFHAATREFNETLNLAINPWLPLKGRTLDWKQVVGGFLFIPLVMALRGFLGYGNSYLMAWSAMRITNDVRGDAFRKVSSLSLDFFQRTATNELITRVDSDSARLSDFLRLGLSDLVREPATIFSVLVMMLWIDWKFTVISLIFIPLCFIPTRMVARKVKELGKLDFANSIAQGGISLESFQNARITKAFGLEEAHAQAYRKASDRSTYYNMKSVQSRGLLAPVIGTLSGMGISAVFIYAVWINCPFPTISSFVIALVMFQGSFKKLSGMGVYFTQLTLALERLMALFKLQPSVREAEHPVAMTGFTRAIEFRHVGFSYGEAPVLQEISFTLLRGKRLGLAGESGSGKSSLLNLLFRFYDPTAGQILIDDEPLENLRIADLRSHLALVSQDILLFNTTAAQNIACGKAGATREDVIAAAKEAHAHEFIEALPQGYDTPLGERGVRLSGGQRQRIAIARAFVRNAPILVLDEATASLDSQSEAEVQKAIDHLAEHRTVICVAHRFSTLRSMDHILVLQKGRIVEQGDFDQLLSARGSFTAMAAKQSIFPQAA
jgi:subfamily B ATP-binding cassette protein MsbA